MSKILKY